MEAEFNIVIDTLQKRLDELEEMQKGCDNIRRSVGGGIGMMDCIRYEQMDELREAIKREQALAAERAPLVMVTDLEMLDMYCEPNSDKEMFEFGRAVQKRFMEKNGLKDEPN